MWMLTVNKVVDKHQIADPFCPVRTAIPTCGLLVDNRISDSPNPSPTCGHQHSTCGPDANTHRFIHHITQETPHPSTSRQQQGLPPGLTKSRAVHTVHSTDDDDYFYLYPSYLKQRDEDGRGYLPYCLTRHWQAQGGQS